jgi:hypothetical protein
MQKSTLKEDPCIKSINIKHKTPASSGFKCQITAIFKKSLLVCSTTNSL